MTDAQYLAWLADTRAARIVLCELDYAGGTRYVASSAFNSLPSDSLPNQAYDDLLTEAIDIETRIDGLLTFGDITLIDDGSITAWAEDAWHGREIRVYLGGPDWPRDDFRLHARGINDGLQAAQRGEISFSMTDLSAQLDELIDTGQLPDDAGPVPLALGSVYNAPAYRVSSQTLTYRSSFLPVTSLSPKDIGNAIPATYDLPGGAFTIDNATQGQLTADIEEQHNTPAMIAQWVADHYGLDVAEIDMPGYTVGLYYNDAVTGRRVLDDLCSGLGAYWFLDALGRLVMRQHLIPDTADITLVSDDIEFGTARLTSTQQPWASLNLKWGRNYAPLNTVAGVVVDNQPAEAERLQRDWSESKATQSLPDFPLATAEQRESCISNATDAVTERDRLLAIRSERRDVYSLDAFTPAVDVGQAISVEVSRLAGRIGRAISVSKSPTRGITELEVWF